MIEIVTDLKSGCMGGSWMWMFCVTWKFSWINLKKKHVGAWTCRQIYSHMNQFVSEIAWSQNNYWFLCSLGIDFFKRFSWLNLWKVTSTSSMCFILCSGKYSLWSLRRATQGNLFWSWTCCQLSVSLDYMNIRWIMWVLFIKQYCLNRH